MVEGRGTRIRRSGRRKKRREARASGAFGPGEKQLAASGESAIRIRAGLQACRKCRATSALPQGIGTVMKLNLHAQYCRGLTGTKFHMGVVFPWYYPAVDGIDNKWIRKRSAVKPPFPRTWW